MPVQVIKTTGKQGQYMRSNAIIIDKVLMQCALWHLNLKTIKTALKAHSHEASTIAIEPIYSDAMHSNQCCNHIEGLNAGRSLSFESWWSTRVNN